MVVSPVHRARTSRRRDCLSDVHCPAGVVARHPFGWMGTGKVRNVSMATEHLHRIIGLAFGGAAIGANVALYDMGGTFTDTVLTPDVT